MILKAFLIPFTLAMCTTNHSFLEVYVTVL
jgi:hypothetical protein